ncbi:DNA/RNA non-specific endonuclease [Enorma sp.]|uniref:DNA/RNA non-specific endonuclease n=1 Tax=Enorma sp. TaxID=1920692 RepID=UPI0025BAB78D|nr:DNA/RNA non-specific endonuclease [Enorma sp.]
MSTLLWMKRLRAHAAQVLVLALSCLFALAGAAGCSGDGGVDGTGATVSVNESALEAGQLDEAELPEYTGEPVIEVNGNEPNFTAEDLDGPSEYYSNLDSLGRCGVTMAIVGEETMPTEEREDISEVHPSGWQATFYDDIVPDQNIYNRCHLIGFQLAGENANERNLITGTNYLNHEGMLPYENEVADYVWETGNHVLYRVTPVFVGDELMARGVHMEAESVEDGGTGVSFNVYCFNVQPGLEIDYETGESWRVESASAGSGEQGVAVETTYVLNTSSMKFHMPDCDSVDDMSARNREEYTGTRDELIARGYEPCGGCHP